MNFISKFNSKLNVIPRTLFISTKLTPNPDSVIFNVANPVSHPENNLIREFSNDKPKDLIISPLARNLLSIEGIIRVFYGSESITLTKDRQFEWMLLKPEIFSILTEHFSSKSSVYVESNSYVDHVAVDNSEDDELTSMIIELIDSRIRPHIQHDGGDVQFMGFSDGVVKVRLMGACVGCPSSIDTLKGGIERMLHYYIPQVTSVEEYFDDVTTIALQKLEDKLNYEKSKEPKIE